MSRESCWNTSWLCILFLLFLIMPTSIIFGSIGVSSYVTEKHDQSVYKSTICFVTNYTITEQQCLIQTGFVGGSYTCYLQIYIVSYNVSNGRELQSTIETKYQHPESYSVSIYHY
jgi:hypothetical protein